MSTEIEFAPPVWPKTAASLLTDKAQQRHNLTTTPPPSSDREERMSFASFKEERDAIAQSFIDSKSSSYARAREEAVDDDSDHDSVSLAGCRHPNAGLSSSRPETAMHAVTPRMSPLVFNKPLTNPGSALHGFVCPCNHFQGWKSIPHRGRLASRSFGDIRRASSGFSWEATEKKSTVTKTPTQKRAGRAPIEMLPPELLGSIIDLLVTDIPPNGCQPRNIDLMSLLLTSHAMHAATLATLYNQVTIPHSSVFRKFLAHVSEYPALGTLVRRLDFSHFNPTGVGMTGRQRAETQNLTSVTLLKCLELLPNLREFLAQEHVDGDLSTEVIRKLFSLPRLNGLDFCGSSSSAFRDAMMTVIRTPGLPLPDTLPISRLSFHECTILPSAFFETILPRLPNLKILDLAHTRVTDDALASIPHTARLTHLNLAKCSSLSGEGVVAFLASHPAAKTLVYLNLMMDAKSAEMLSAIDLTALLPILPVTLRSLNLKGSNMTPNHIELLRPLSRHLEELGLGRALSYSDVASLVREPENDDSDEKEAVSWVPHSLRYIDVSDLEPAQVDFSLLLGRRTTILNSTSLPLEVTEVSPKVHDKLKGRTQIFARNGWAVKEAGRRGWLVRDMSGSSTDGKSSKKDDGSREWKRGATFWGMRKVPIARTEVGGMYGLYMFKR